MSEKFSLKWNDYQSNWNSSLSELRNDSELADVTLISEDKVEFSAHKVVLTSCSNMFKFILKRNIHSNPLLYLGGVSSVNLGFILDYVYHGEVSIFQEQLDSFLESAQKLEVQGLLGLNDEQGHKEKNEDQLDSDVEDYHHQPAEEKKMVKIDQSIATRRHYSRAPSKISPNNTKKFDVGSMTPEEIKKKTGELYEKINGVWSCFECEYSTSIDTSTMRKHIETHFEGLSYTCSFCSKEFRTKNSLYKHKTNNHQKPCHSNPCRC